MFDAYVTLYHIQMHFDASASDGVCKYYGKMRLFITQLFSFCHNVFNCYAPDHTLMFGVVTFVCPYSFKDVYHIFIVLGVWLKGK